MVAKVQGRMSWRGLAAVYSDAEREIIAPLPVPEQFILHQLKALFGGEIQPDPCQDTNVSQKPEERTYIDAEDIPFGEPYTAADYTAPQSRGTVKRPKPLYGLHWTRDITGYGTGSSLHRTKKEATRRMRAWKRWKERNGWKVVSHETGYFAGKDGVREAILIREHKKPAEAGSLRLR